MKTPDLGKKGDWGRKTGEKTTRSMVNRNSGHGERKSKITSHIKVKPNKVGKRAEKG